MTTQTAETADLKVYEPYTDIKAELVKLAEENDKAVFDYEDPKGNKMARSHIYNFRRLKGEVERRRKEMKADVLERGRLIDGTAKEITARIEEMIAVHETPLLEIEQREKDRVAAIQRAIDLIGESSETPTTFNPPSSEIAEAIARVEAIEIDASVYQERMADASNLKGERLADLKGMHAEAVERETKDAELKRLQAEAAAREQAEREERIRAEAEARAKAEAEAKAQREREEAERREREAAEQAKREQEAAERREREAVERAERAERKAREAEEAREREAAARKAADEKRAADKKHRIKVGDAAVSGVAAAIRDENVIDSPDDEIKAVAETVVQAIIDGKVPHVTITF